MRYCKPPIEDCWAILSLSNSNRTFFPPMSNQITVC